MEFVGTGQAKLLLFGEHAAVQGFPAVGLTLPWQTRVCLSSRVKGNWNLGLVKPAHRDIMSKMLNKSVDTLQKKGFLSPGFTPGGIVEVSSTVPEQSGFGSSAAVCVALVSVLMKFCGSSFGFPCYQQDVQKHVWEAAHEMEKLFHGTPSGIDTGLASTSGLHGFSPSPSGLPERKALPSQPLFLVVGAVKRAGNTRKLILDLGRKYTAGDRETVAGIKGLGALAESAIRILEQAYSPKELGECSDRAQKILKNLGLSSPELESILTEGRNLGAFGGKLSGAGGGGAFFLITDSEKSSKRIAGELAHFCVKTGIKTASSPVSISR